MGDSQTGHESEDTQREDHERRELYDFERIKLVMHDHLGTVNRLRDRIITLGSVLFGISLLAAQIQQPENMEIGVEAWRWIGASIMASLIGSFLEIGAAYNVRHDLKDAWLKREHLPDAMPMNIPRLLGGLTLVFSAFALGRGVWLLIKFVESNS